ncbi:MAG: choice-of-anchor L domain-containing protein [Bacteroidales bacterium]|nr:choice-of-anchor L domain-containing protein [Bacteroidales bacterium]
MKNLSIITGLQLLLIIFATFNFAQGQIIITSGPEVSPIDMVENILCDGIIYSNVTFQGADASRGIFTNGETTNLGLESGIFLTSGAGYIIPGPNLSSSAGVNNGLGGHPSLNALTTSTTYDAAVLEFDFIPESDTLRFKYVFGSEEYNEWVGSSFNDVFGYFVTGPDPAGGYYNDKNIAIVPGTTNTSVTINNVNNGYSPPNIVPTGPCTHCEYYSDNTFGLTLEYDGLTTILVAWLLVVPCEEYHLKIGVADAGDHIYDSGVFLKENSIEIPEINIETELYPQGISNNMIEGCVEADIIFWIPNPGYAPVTVCYEIGGTAINGIDYEGIPDCVTFEEGEDTAYIHVYPYKDGIIEGEETIELIIENTLGCIIRYDTVIFTIGDYVDMISTISPDIMICSGQEIELWVNVYYGFPPYTYSWEPGSYTNDTITVSPEETTTYTVTYFDMCLESNSDSTKVTVLPDYLNDIITFSFEAANNPFLEEDVIGQFFGDSIYLVLPLASSLENLIATFIISNCATAYVDGIEQISGVTANDFTNPVSYQVIAQNGDEKDWLVIVDLETGQMKKWMKNISIFPNPVKEKIYISQAKGCELSLINSLGVELFRKQIASSHFSFDVSNFEDGVYYLQFDNEQQQLIKKVIIDR